jgi:hypothetical protein
VDREVDPLLSEICDRAMQIEPGKRFATADDFRLALEQYLVVTGESVDTSSIAAFMRHAFAAERGAMHRMIDSHLKDADLSESLVRRLRPTPREITQDDPTTVADLSELIQSSRSELPKPPVSDGDNSTVNGWNSSLRSGSGRKVWIAAAVIGIAALAVYALRDRLPLATAPEAPETKTLEQAATVPPPPVAQPKPSEPAPAGVVAPPPVVATPQQAHAQENAPRDRAERTARRQRSQDSADDEGGPMPGMLFGDLDADPENIPFQGPRMKDLEEEVPQAGSKEAPAIGEDLRQHRKDNRRKLDLEDPFQ